MNRFFHFRDSFILDCASVRRIALFTLALMFIAHGFCFFNPTYSGESVMLSATQSTYEQIAQWHWLQPFYFAARGSIASPLVVGLLSTLYIAATAIMIADLLAITQAVPQFLLCCILCVNPGALSAFASSLHTADACFLALLLSSVSIWLAVRVRLGFLPAAILLCAAGALQITALVWLVLLFILHIIVYEPTGYDPAYLPQNGHMPRRRFLRTLSRSSLRNYFSILAAYTLGTTIFCIVYFAFLHLLSINPALYPSTLTFFSVPESASTLEKIINPTAVSAFFSPATAYPNLSIVMRVLLLALCLVSLVSLLIQGLFLKSFLVFFFFLFIHFIMLSFPVVVSSYYHFLPFILLDLTPIVLIFHPSCQQKKTFRALAVLAVAVITLGVTVFSNQVYLKKNLEAHSTLSFMTRVIDRIERTEGYDPGYTPVAIIGTPEESILAAPRAGFEHLDVLEAAKNNFAITTSEDMIWYTWEILGYPLNFVSTFDQDRFAGFDEVKAMPVFPADGCCTFIGDTLVLKLSDSAE